MDIHVTTLKDTSGFVLQTFQIQNLFMTTPTARIAMVSLALLVLCHRPTVAQKNNDNGPVGIFSSQKEYFEFMGNVKRIAYGPEGNPELQAMVPMLNDIVLNQPIGQTASKYRSQGTNLDLLSDKAIREEIEMVDEQYEELKQVQKKIQSRVAQEIRGIDFSKRETVTTQIKRIRDRARKELDSLLLPHQVKRLQQLHLQSALRGRSLVDVITSDPLKTDLEIDDEQTQQLKKEEKKIEQELQKEIERLRKEAREKLISRLKPEQEKKLKELVGEEFDFPGGEPGKNPRKLGKKIRPNK